MLAKLKTATADLEVVMHRCEKITEAALKLDRIPDKLRESVARLQDTLETTEKTKADATFMFKYKKCNATGIPASSEPICDLIAKLKAATEELDADCRVVKAFAAASMPRKVPKESK